MALKIACTTTAPKEEIKFFNRNLVLGTQYDCSFVRINIHMSIGDLG